MCARLSEVSDLPYAEHGIIHVIACSREYFVRSIHDFVLKLSQTRTPRDFVMVVVTRLFKIMHFITCKKTEGFVTVEYLFF